MIILERADRNEINSFWDLKNADELFDEIIEKLKQFDKDQNQYDTDVYLYVNDDMTGYLEDFVNVGGNSWLDDDHYTLWTDKQRYTDWSDFWQTEGEIADALDMTLDELCQEVADYLNRITKSSDYVADDVDYHDIYDYINDERDDYKDTLIDIEQDYYDTELESEYRDRASEIVDVFDNNIRG